MKKITYLGAALLAVLSAKAQYEHGFEGSTTMPEGFTVIAGGGSNQWVVTDSPFDGAYEGTNVASISFNATAHDDYLVFPAIEVTPGTNERISFQIKSRSANFLESYEVLLSTTGLAKEDFTVVLQPNVEAISAWVKKTFDLSSYAGQTVYVAVRATGTNEFNLYLDNVINDTAPGCNLIVNAEDISVTNVTNVSATINLPEFEGADGYQVTLTTPDGVEVLESETATLVLENLTPSVAYSFTALAMCNGELGEPSGPVTFTTACDSITELDVIQGNEGTTGTELDNCWTAQLVSGTVNWTGSNENTGELLGSAAEGTRVFRKAWNNSSVANLISPVYDLASIDVAAFKVSMHLYQRTSVGGAEDKYIIYVNNSPSTEGAVELGQVLLRNGALPSNGWYLHEFAIPAEFADSATVHFIINSGAAGYAAGMDAFAVKEDNGCHKPADVEATDVTTTTATVTWTAIEGVAEYEYFISTTNTAPEGSGISVETTSVALTDLEVNTAYFVFVRSICGEGVYSDWSEVMSFTTECSDITELDVVQGNENTTGTAIDQCWSTGIVSGTGSAWVGANQEAGEIDFNSGEGSRIFRKPYSSSTVANLISPAYNLNAIGIDAFKVAMKLYQNTSNTATQKYIVYVNSSASVDGAIQLGEVSAKGTEEGWIDVDFQLPVAFSSEEQVYFIIQSNGSGYDVAMDAFVVLEDNGCFKPVVEASATSSSTATFAWTAEGEPTGFEYVVATVNDVTTGTVVVATDSSVELEALLANTNYYVFVRSICGEGVYSDWSEVVSFTTECSDITELDVVQGNENTTGSALDQCWSTQQVSGTQNWVGANSTANELNVATVEGTRVFSRPWNSTSVSNLISPSYNLGAIGVESYKVSMKLYQRNTVSTNTPNASYKIFVNTAATTEGAAQLAEVMFADTTLAANGWTDIEYAIPAEYATAESVYFIIQANGSYFGLGMDAFVVSEGEPLSTGDFNTARFVVYPNPVKDILHLTGEAAIEQVNVYNMLGQEVMVNRFSTNDAQLDMSHLSNGTYFVKVTAEGATKTIKVVKN